MEKTLEIDSTTYLISPEQYRQEEFKKHQIILAESLRADSNHLIRLKNKDFGKTMSYPTFTITREGKIYQHFNPRFYSEFMGVPEIDRMSISIVLENMGKLFLQEENDEEKYVNWCNEQCSPDRVYNKDWKDFSFWEIHSVEQINALVKLCRQLITQYDIMNDCLGFNFFNDETKYFEGIVCRGNYSYDFCDLNPSFDFKQFMFKMEISLDE